MKHRILGLCILALASLSATSVARADTFDFSFTGVPFFGSGLVYSGSGTLTASEEGSTDVYNISGITGTVTDWAGTSNITGLAGTNVFSGNDNKLVYPGITPIFFLPTIFFDSNGVSFDLANGDQVNLNDTLDLENSTLSGSKGFELSEFDNVSVSKNSPVPEPSSLALFGTGILGIAGAIRLKLRLG